MSAAEDRQDAARVGGRTSWTRRCAYIVVGWYMAMTFPKDDSLLALALSAIVATFGVFVVGMVCYVMGKEDAP